MEKFEHFYLNIFEKNLTETLEEIAVSGIKFHEFVIDSSSNQRIKNILSDLRVQFEISRIFFLNPNPDVRSSRGIKSIEEHLSKIEALKKGDGDLAELRMKEHIGNSEKSILYFRGGS